MPILYNANLLDGFLFFLIGLKYLQELFVYFRSAWEPILLD
jgi:hypothetical protein